MLPFREIKGEAAPGKGQEGDGNPFFLVSGPCVIESEGHCLQMAARLKEITSDLGIPFIFKASYDKANRTSSGSYRGPGLRKGLRILERIRRELTVPILSDIHAVEEVAPATEVLDVLQIPAFLCRQTDLVMAAASSGKTVNIKKGQFLSPWDVRHVLQKAREAGAQEVWVTERGSSFGYNNLVVDFKSLPIIRSLGVPVIFDATHSLQLPGAGGSRSGGQPEFVPHLARAAVAVGTDGLFMETHDRPEEALSDAASTLHLDRLSGLLEDLLMIDRVLKGSERPGFQAHISGSGSRT